MKKREVESPSHSWKRQGKAKWGPSILLPNALKDVWKSVWDEMHLQPLQPHTFPFPSTAPHGTDRHFWQLSATGSHFTAFQEQSTEPAITSAMARDSTVLVVFECSTTRREQQQTRWELFDFWSTKSRWFWGTSIPYSSCAAKEHAAEVAKEFCC